MRYVTCYTCAFVCECVNELTQMLLFLPARWECPEAVLVDKNGVQADSRCQVAEKHQRFNIHDLRGEGRVQP